MTQTWTVVGPASLVERGNALTGESPIELQNAYMLTEGAVSMRQGFSTEAYALSGLDGPLEWIARYVTDEGGEEAFAASNNASTAELGRRAGGVWGPESFSDTAVAASLRFAHSANLNGKLFLAYDSNVNRLHVWDGTSVRRVGLIAASTPSVAQQGVGTLTWTRYYRTRNARLDGTITEQLSEPSTAVSLSIVTRLGATITKGAVSGDGETHWRVEYSDGANGPWYVASALIVVATTTYSDTAATIDTTTLAPVLGLYIPPPSAKYLATDGAVLFLAGAWETTGATGETTPTPNRVWYTRPLGSSDISDDESIPDTNEQSNYLTIGDAGPITGVAGPNYGEFYVFKNNSVGKLVTTGDLTSPYGFVSMSDGYGCVNQRVICTGDLGGVPATFFCDTNAVYALTSGGIQCISEAIARDLRQTYVQAETAFMAFDPVQRVLFVQVASEPGPTPGSYRTFTFDVSKQRWSGFELAGATSGWIIGVGLIGTSTIMGGTGAAIVNGAFLEDPDGGKRLYLVGQTTATTGSLFKWGRAVALDADAAYSTIARYRRAFALEAGRKVNVGVPTVWYRNPQGTTTGTLSLMLSYIRDADDVRSQTKVLSPTDDENGIAVKQVSFESVLSADVSTLDVRLVLSYSGTAFQSVVTPTIDALSVPYTWQESVTQ